VSQIRLEKTRASGLELQLEGARKTVSEATDKLARKTQKKRM
jgi:hypothetical protein